MGPNALWLIESLTEVLEITPGTRVLDLGCGKAMSSIFLAKELGAQVWATDLWISASENHQRITDAGVAHLVTPIHAEAHTLPFASNFFDVIVSVDAYHYFGTDDLYLGYLVDFLKAGGRFGAVVPAVLAEVGVDVPQPLQPFWEWEFCSFHSPQWWRDHWAKTGKVTVAHADSIPDGWKDWHRFADHIARSATGWEADAAANERAMLEIDQGSLLGFTRIVAAKA